MILSRLVSFIPFLEVIPEIFNNFVFGNYSYYCSYLFVFQHENTTSNMEYKFREVGLYLASENENR